MKTSESDTDINKIAEDLKNFFPDAIYRKMCLSRLVESIKEAHAFGCDKWGIYNYNEGIRLLVGSLIVLTIHKTGIWLTLDKEKLCENKKRYHELDSSKYWRWETGNYSEYLPVPSMNGYYIPSNDDSDIWTIIKDLHFIYIKKVAQKYQWLRMNSQPLHSDLLLQYLRVELNNNEIPFPNYKQTDFEIAEEIPDADKWDLYEGAKKQITVNRYERDPTARKKCLQKYGYKCSVCGFDFKTAYGKIGTDYIHVHHLKPLNEIKKEYKINPINDLRPVCPNCHSMLHVGKLTIEELKNKLKFNWNL